MSNEKKVLEQVQPEILKMVSNFPEFGTVTLTIHLMEGRIKRFTHIQETSVVPKNLIGIDTAKGGAK